MKLIIPASIFAIVTAVILGVVLFDSFTEKPTTSVQPLPAGGDFTLHSDTQKDISLKDFRGKVVLLYFGYTSCPDICPTSLASIGSALNKLPEDEQNKAQVIFVSVDPERDSLDKLKNYTRYFHKNILGITGTKEEVDKIVHAYSASYKKVESNSAMGYLVDHSASIYVIDPRGKLVKMLPHGTDSEKIAQTIQTLLRTN